MTELNAFAGSSHQPVAKIAVSEPEVGSQDEINLGELWAALRRRKKIVLTTAAFVFVLSGIYTVHQRIFNPVYRGSFKMLISDPISGDNRRGIGGSLKGSAFEDLAISDTSDADVDTLIELLTSPVMFESIAEKFDLSPESIASRVKIGTVQDAWGILNVSITGSDPKEDQMLLEDVSDTFLKAALQERKKRLNDGLDFLNKQAPELESKLSTIQNEIADFRNKYSLLEPTSEGGALKKREEAMSTLILDLEAGRSRLLRVREEIANGTLSARGFQEAIGGLGNGQTATGGVQGLTISDVDQSLLQQLLKVETELAEARAKYNPDSSMVLGLESRLNQLRPLLRNNQLEAVDAALNLNAGRLATAKEQAKTLNAQFKQQPTLIKQYEGLQTRLKIAQENLAGLVSARENFQLEIAQRSIPWRIISPPVVNPNPIKPSPQRNLALGALLGLVAGTGAGLLRDRFDHVFHSPEEVEADLDRPLIGHIPHVAMFKQLREDKRFMLDEVDEYNTNLTKGKGTNEYNYQRFFYQESFRNLYTSLRFLNSEKPIKSIVLTSSLPAEGKSLVNCLLAKTLSEMGQRVLLIDGDLRKPQLHVRIGLNNLRGLSNLITDSHLNWRETLQPVKGYEGWSVITAGTRPPDPTRLLSSKRLHELVQDIEASEQFDVVLFDTPPVIGLSDAALIAQHCDGLMLLVSLSKVDRSLPKESLRRITASGSQLLGVVTNSVVPSLSKAQTVYGTYGYGPEAYATAAAYAKNDFGSTQYNLEDPADINEASDPSTPTNKLSRPLSKFVQRSRSQFNRLMTWLDS